MAASCDGVVPVDQAALQDWCAALCNVRRVRPAVYLIYYDCLRAVRRDDAEALAALLQELVTRPAGMGALAVRNFGDAGDPPAVWLRFARALASGGSNLQPTPVAPGRFVTASRRLRQAQALLALAAPELAAEIELLIGEIVFAEDQAAPDGGFGGATSFEAWGAILLNARRHGTPVAMANGLVHEAAHALLFAWSGGAPVVENAPDALYGSPLRPDQRPMEGVFHATFVSARMCYAMDRLLASGMLDEQSGAEARAARENACRAFVAGHCVVAAHARPTAVGAAAMAMARDYMCGHAAVSLTKC
jgi:hypothetical protein